VGQRALILRRLVGAVLLLALALIPAFQPLASDAANAFPKIVPALAVIALIDAKGKVSGFGTGFCIGSDDKHSYFATNHHVVAAVGGSAPELIAILASDPSQHHPARVVVDSGDPDLAVVEIDVPNVPVLILAITIPQAGDSVAIAGFPWNEGQRWGALLSGAGFKLGVGQRSFPPELEPSYHSGPVSAIHGAGQYYIQYDALTDHGNSGGPLFDPTTGEVYGIVQATVPGMSDPLADTPPSVYNNLAISVREGSNILVKSPIPPRFDGAPGSSGTVTRASYDGSSGTSLFSPPAPPSSGGTRSAPTYVAPTGATQSASGPSNSVGSSSYGPPTIGAPTRPTFDPHSATHGLSGPPACIVGSGALSRAYGEWAQAHGSLKSLAVVTIPVQANRLYAGHDIGAETTAIAKISDAAKTIRAAGSVQSAKLAEDLLHAVNAVSDHDRSYVSGVENGSSSPKATASWSASNKSVERPLSDAAGRVSALLDCT
jgi:S1-C subfamily serine protease